MRTQDNRRRFVEDRILSRKNNSELTMPVMQFLLEMEPTPKRNDVKVWLKYGYVKVNGVVTTQFDEPVEPGVTVEVNISRPFVVFRHPRVQLVYEDDDIIVINKGYGLLSVGTGSARHEETAYNIVKDYIKRQHPGNKLFVVHRLDRETSGLMMFAKSVEAQTAMQHNWSNMVISRTYVAVLEGALKTDEGQVKSNLAETSQFKVYSTETEEGRPSVTNYRVLKRGNGYTLAEFSLETGRKNQIRVHAKDLGHPIIGDRKYGAKGSPIKRLALHARTLRFAHPMTRRDMNFETPIPSKFLMLVNR